MKKKIFISYCLICLGLPLFAQKAGNIIYEFTIPSLTKGHIETNGLLEFNDSISLFTYYKIGLIDSNTKMSLSSSYFDPKSGAVLMTTQYDEKGMQVYRNFKNKTIIFRQTRVKPLEPFIVDDNWIEIKWSIIDKQKNIMGYECQKAIGTFRGREYTVWFTKQIPVPYGPWKLYGLPGLILEAYDKKDMVHLIAKQISYPDTTVARRIFEPPSEPIVKTIKEFAHYEDFYLEQVEKAFQGSLPESKGLTIRLAPKDETTPEKILLQRKYDMENKWEWENEDQKSNIIINND